MGPIQETGNRCCCVPYVCVIPHNWRTEEGDRKRMLCDQGCLCHDARSGSA